MREPASFVERYESSVAGRRLTLRVLMKAAAPAARCRCGDISRLPPPLRMLWRLCWTCLGAAAAVEAATSDDYHAARTPAYPLRHSRHGSVAAAVSRRPLHARGDGATRRGGRGSIIRLPGGSGVQITSSAAHGSFAIDSPQQRSQSCSGFYSFSGVSSVKFSQGRLLVYDLRKTQQLFSFVF